ncbi:DNA repair protein RAD5B-like [Lolium rigidum]|uniref:DNA repair protein RAD5B-like n=1 Tax=Lolium rigidum TaxID=89674 RepID=UPI001F5DEE79|nr:DNA repair protein RAD5B-like [Lolium rigidum]
MPCESPDEVVVKRERIDAGSDEATVKVEAAVEVQIKSERIDAGHHEVKVEAAGEIKVKREPIDGDTYDAKLEAPGEVRAKAKREPIDAGGEHCRAKKEEQADEIEVQVKEEGESEPPHRVKEEAAASASSSEEDDSSEDEVEIIDPPPRSKKRHREDDDDGGVDFIDLTTSRPAPYLNPKPIRAMPPPGAMATPASEWKMVLAPEPAELDEYPPDHREWVFYRKSYATGLSTCRGRKWLDAGEVVRFAFPSYELSHGGIRVSHRQAAALAETVRISTNRSGEIGKLSPEWARCLAPLVDSSKVMIQGKMVFPMMELRLMQEVLLYVSFYIHRSSLYLISPKNAHHQNNPLCGLFKLLGQFGVAEA